MENSGKASGLGGPNGIGPAAVVLWWSLNPSKGISCQIRPQDEQEAAQALSRRRAQTHGGGLELIHWKVFPQLQMLEHITNRPRHRG